MAPSSSAPSLPARLPSRAHARLPGRKAPPASAPRPLLLSFPAPARRRRAAGLRAPAAQQRSAECQFGEDDGEDEEEYGYDGEEEEWEEDEDEVEEMDVEAMEEEARGAAADLAKHLARELHIGERLHLVAQPFFAFRPSRWPVEVIRITEAGLALCPPVHVSVIH